MNSASAAEILILDDDPVLRLARFALAGPGEIGEDWVRLYFSPEEVDPARVAAIAYGLQPQDGVSLASAARGAGGSNAAILIFRRGTIDARMIAAHPRLKLIQRLGARSDGIDLAATAARGIRVSCLPRPTLILTAEHAILLMLALTKRLIAADRAVREGAWDGARVRPLDGVAYNWAGLTGLSGLHGKRLGIIGLGEVGAIVAERARAFGMSVAYVNRSRLPVEREQELGVVYAPRDELLGACDIVSLHAPGLPANHRMMDKAAFAAMKGGAILINTARGKLVDEEALYQALVSGRLAGAGLDVHWQEPRPQPDRLARLDNVILTPHCAAGARTGVIAELSGLFDNCRAVLAGRAPRFEVLPPLAT